MAKYHAHVVFNDETSARRFFDRATSGWKQIVHYRGSWQASFNQTILGTNFYLLINPKFFSTFTDAKGLPVSVRVKHGKHQTSMTITKPYLF